MMKQFIMTAVISSASILAMAQTSTVSHIVQRGETIESIAEYYHVSVDDINKANPNTEGLVYVGMKLMVPIVGTSDNVSSAHGTSSETNMEVMSKNERNKTYSKTENNANGSYVSNIRKRNESRMLWGVSYFAQDFSEVKLSGHYGITIDALNIGDSLFGFNVTVGSFNWGLADNDATNDIILFGPNISYEVVPRLSVALPLQAMCICSFEGNDTKTSWGWAVSPRVYFQIGSKVNINAGVLINGGFKKQEKSTCGFTVGLGFGI